MSDDQDEQVVVVEEEVEITVVGEIPMAGKDEGSSWAPFWVISLIVAILAGVMMWLPMTRQNRLWGRATNDTIIAIGDDICRRVPGPPFCNDIVIDKESGLAFLACDPFKPSFYPPFELYNASRVYGDGGIWLFDTNDPSSPPIKLSFREEESPPHGFHPISLTISPIEKQLSPELDAPERVIRLLAVSYPENITEGVVEVIDYYLPPASFLTNIFGIKNTERGGELLHVATIKSQYFTAPDGIVAVKDQPSVLSEVDNHAIPSFYLTNTYRGKGWSRKIIEKGIAISKADLVFYNARAEGALRVGFGLDRPGPITTDDFDIGSRVYVATQDGLVHLFEQYYIDSAGKKLSSVPLEDRELQVEYLTHPLRNEEIEIFHPTFVQSSHLQANFPVMGIAALPPLPNTLGGDIFIIGSPKHYRFDEALRNDVEAPVPVSIIQLRPFYYVLNATSGSQKVYRSDDPRLRTGTKSDLKGGIPERKKWFDATTLWTDVDFGAGPGGIAIRDLGGWVTILGVGGGKKGGVVSCTLDIRRPELTEAKGSVR